MLPITIFVSPECDVFLFLYSFFFEYILVTSHIFLVEKLKNILRCVCVRTYLAYISSVQTILFVNAVLLFKTMPTCANSDALCLPFFFRPSSAFFLSFPSPTRIPAGLR